jgi:N-acyl-D-amino-acid deacylase
MEQFAQNLAAPDLRQEIKDYIMAGKWFNLNPLTSRSWAREMRVGASKASGFTGKTIAEIAAEREEEPLDAMMDVIEADPWTRSSGHRIDSDEVKRVFFKHPLAMVAIDTFLVDTTYEVRYPPYQLPNPNSFGGMARYIRLYALGLLGLEEGVRRITSLAAKRLGLKDRGRLAAGMKADIVVFRPAAVREKGDDEEPRQYPEGYSWVFVNGTAAMENGRLTLSRSGRVLRRQG